MVIGPEAIDLLLESKQKNLEKKARSGAADQSGLVDVVLALYWLVDTPLDRLGDYFPDDIRKKSIQHRSESSVDWLDCLTDD